MALVNCKECGAQISSSARVCPRCGRKRRKTSVVTWLVALFGLAVFVEMVRHANPDASPASPASSPSAAQTPAVATPASIAEDAKRRELAELRDAEFTCEDQVKASLHDPASAVFDDARERFLIMMGTKPPDKYVLLVKLRAKNGFGGMRHFGVVCSLSRKNAQAGWIYKLKEVPP